MLVRIDGGEPIEVHDFVRVEIGCGRELRIAVSLDETEIAVGDEVDGSFRGSTIATIQHGRLLAPYS